MSSSPDRCGTNGSIGWNGTAAVRGCRLISESGRGRVCMLCTIQDTEPDPFSTPSTAEGCGAERVRFGTVDC